MLLDQNAQSELLSRITESGQASEPVKSSLETANVGANQNETPRESNSQQQQSTEQVQMIPYDRFKKVNETKKEYQKKYEEQQRELEQLRKELDSKSSNQGYNDKWLEDLLAEPENPADSKLKHIESRLQMFELKEAEKELSSIVKSTVRRHSDLDPELVESVVYQSISENPNADVDDAVDRLREFIGYVQTKGTRQPQTQQVAPQKPSASPRPSMAGARNYSTQSTDKPRSLADAREALYNYLKR